MSGCPLGHRCESCGAEAPDLVLVVHSVELNGDDTGRRFCLTSCPRCARSTVPPPIRPDTMIRLVAQHTAHLNGARP